MDSSPASPRAPPVNLTICAPNTPDLEQSNLQPPSPTSLCSCSSVGPRSSMSPAAAAHPRLSPGWEAKEEYQDPQQRQLHDSGATAAGIAPIAAGLTISAPTISTDPSSPVAAVAAGPSLFSSANLRPDLVPPTRVEAAASFLQALSPAPGINVENARETVERPGFFSSSTDTAALQPSSDAAAAGPGEPILPGATSHTTSPSMIRPPSSCSGISGVFELDLDSPQPTSETPVHMMQDFAGSGNIEGPQDSLVMSRDTSGEVSAGTTDSRSAAPWPGSSVPWGRVAPSPDSSDQPLPGPWGSLQGVMDEIKMLSPSSPSYRVPHPFLYGARPSSTPPAEERKGFPGSTTTTATTTTTTRGRLADSPATPSSSFSSSYHVDDDRQQQQAQPHRSPFPSSSPHLVTSPPIPTAFAGKTPIAAIQQPASSASTSRSPPSRHLSVVEEQQQQPASSSEVSEAAVAAVDADALTVPTMKEREGQTPPGPLPGGALGRLSSAPFPFTAGDEAAEAATATAAGDEAGAARIGSASYDVDGGGQKLEGPRGSVTAGELVNVPAALPVEGATVGGRGYVGRRFIQAAEALSESPQLRRAAGAAATAVSAAAGTARVQFTYTSRTIGKILVASAKSFEEFVDEQLREDGSGQVLRREGATGLLVPRGRQLSQAFIVGPGCCLCWEFRVKDFDLGFALRRRSQGMGGSTEEDIFELKRYCSGETFQGRWTADANSNSSAVVIMVWDNSYSCLRPKTLAYKAQVNRPGVDPAAPPPPPPSTPADTHTAQPPPPFGVGSVGGAEDTEAFAIDESEGEDPSPPSASVSVGGGIGGVGGVGGRIEDEKGDGESLTAASSRWQRA